MYTLRLRKIQNAPAIVPNEAVEQPAQSTPTKPVQSRRLERCNSSPEKLSSPEKRRLLFLAHEASSEQVKLTMERVQKTRSELRSTIEQTQQTILRYKEIEKELDYSVNQIVFIEPIPEAKNKGVVVEPNLTRRIQQRANLILAKRNAAEIASQNLDLKVVSEAPRQKSATIVKRRNDSWHEVKKTINPLPLQLMPMLRSASRLSQVKVKPSVSLSATKTVKKERVSSKGSTQQTQTFMALRAVAESKLGFGGNLLVQRQVSKENNVRVRKVVLGHDKHKILDDVLNTKVNYCSQKGKNRSKSRKQKTQLPVVTHAACASPRILKQACMN